jgi:prenyl protein peptidase
VLPFYASRKTRPSPALNRDAPSVIKARIQSVSLAVTVSILATLYILHVTAKLPLSTCLHYLGFYPIDLRAIISSLLLTTILYLAPLYESIFINKDLSPLSSLLSNIQSILSSSQGYRNYIAGPLTEELLFRCTIIPLHLLSHVTTTQITFLTPLYFGIAHLHHFYEFRLTHPHTPLQMAFARSIFQFAYTTVFGWYAAFIFLRTGNLYVVFIIHAFCNWVGLPRFWGRVSFRNGARASSVIVRGKDDTDAMLSSGNGQRTPLIYTVIYYMLLLVGVYGFYEGLFPLTSSTIALVDFGVKKR